MRSAIFSARRWCPWIKKYIQNFGLESTLRDLNFGNVGSAFVENHDERLIPLTDDRNQVRLDSLRVLLLDGVQHLNSVAEDRGASGSGGMRVHLFRDKNSQELGKENRSDQRKLDMGDILIDKFCSPSFERYTVR